MKDRLYEIFFAGQNNLSVSMILFNFLVAAVLAALICLSYRLSHQAAVYSRKFNVSLAMLTLITALVMSVIGNNIALSLGMVGALSIVRFRTAIKDSRDTAYIFWAIAVGICCGVSDYIVAGIGSAVIFLFLLLFGVVRDNRRMLVILHLKASDAERARELVTSYFDRKAVLCVQNVDIASENEAELIWECSDQMIQKAEQQKGTLAKLLTEAGCVNRISIVAQADDISA